jgi:hypothetical protein
MTVHFSPTPGCGDATTLASVPITSLPGLPTAFPFGIFFAHAHTLYVCDEGDRFTTIGSAQFGEVFGGIAFAPSFFGLDDEGR